MATTVGKIKEMRDTATVQLAREQVRGGRRPQFAGLTWNPHKGTYIAWGPPDEKGVTEIEVPMLGLGLRWLRKRWPELFTLDEEEEADNAP